MKSVVFNFSTFLIPNTDWKVPNNSWSTVKTPFSCLCYNEEFSTSKDMERFHWGARETTFAAIEIESKWFKDSHIGPLNWIEKPPWLSKELGDSCLVY